MHKRRAHPFDMRSDLLDGDLSLLVLSMNALVFNLWEVFL